MASIFEFISYGEFVRFIICLSLDVIEFIIPFLLTPFVGDLFDIIGLTACVFMFRWVGLFALLELVPGLDPIPINLITWLIWVFNKRWKDLEYKFR